MNRTFAFIILYILNLTLHAQLKQDVCEILAQPGITNNVIEIIQSNKVHNALLQMTKKQAELNGISGFRINIFFSSDKQAEVNANNEQIKFITNYPEIKTYLKYDAPFFKIYAGDFRTKTDALKVLNLIKPTFPNAYIVQDIINFPKIEQKIQ